METYLTRAQVYALAEAMNENPTMDRVKIKVASDGKMRATAVQMVEVEKQIRLTKPQKVKA
jgi:hypothetical protein